MPSRYATSYCSAGLDNRVNRPFGTCLQTLCALRPVYFKVHCRDFEIEIALVHKDNAFADRDGTAAFSHTQGSAQGLIFEELRSM